MRRPGDALIRCLDLCAVAAGLLLAWPLLAAGLVLSAAETRAFPLFSSRREGRGGRRFTHVKIRTMPGDAPLAPSYLAGGGAGRACAFMRRTHLDELPELVLVLTGSMSLVGPRPLVPSIRASYESVPGPLRSTVRPGWTGPAQLELAVRGSISSERQFRLDEAWCASRSPAAWCSLLARTLRLALRLSGRRAPVGSAPGEPPGAGRYRRFASALFLGRGRSKSP